MSQPLVSVICLCYNQADFVEESISSVLNQTYAAVELIIVDDGSTDNSREIINQFSDTKNTKILLLDKNVGNCSAFNQGLKVAKGKYIIDLAADDLLHPKRIAVGVKALESSADDYGVTFCDVALIDADTNIIGNHYKRDETGKLQEKVTDGDIYEELLQRYFVAAPAMMTKRIVYDALGGYDESLSYEDFDFWVRSSRTYKYKFTDAILVSKRILKNSLSDQQYKKGSKQLLSTYTVCKKAFGLNKTKAENQALVNRIRYEIRQVIMVGDYQIAEKYLELWKKITGKKPFLYQILVLLKLNLIFLKK